MNPAVELWANSTVRFAITRRALNACRNRSAVPRFFRAATEFGIQIAPIRLRGFR